MAMAPPIGSAQGIGFAPARTQVLDSLERYGTVLRADLSGLGTAHATAVQRYSDGRIGLDMQASGVGGNLDRGTRAEVYTALIASAYPRFDRAAIDRLIQSDDRLRAGMAAFVNAASGATLHVSIPYL